MIVATTAMGSLFTNDVMFRFDFILSARDMCNIFTPYFNLCSDVQPQIMSFEKINLAN